MILLIQKYHRNIFKEDPKSYLKSFYFWFKMRRIVKINNN